MKEIKLSQQGKNKGKYVAFVDDEDYEKVNQFNWYVLKLKNTNYAYRCVYVDGKYKSQYLHHYVLNIENARLNNIEVDHIYGNGLNNQKHNLRICTKSQNMMNMMSHKNSTSIYKGVSYDKERKKFQAKIWNNNKIIFLGRFVSETDAAKKYDQYAKELFGDFSKLNFPAIF